LSPEVPLAEQLFLFIVSQKLPREWNENKDHRQVDEVEEPRFPKGKRHSSSRWKIGKKIQSVVESSISLLT
jgi:hypothetical protein